MIALPLLPRTTSSKAPAGLGDRLGRRVDYLRLSLTRACAMRCLYCRPETDLNRRDDELTAREVEQLVRHLVRTMGVRKVRLSGGDPSSRSDLVKILESIASIDGLDDLCMTTHGLSLATHAKDYAAAGLRRVNISLDTLDADSFHRMTGVRGLDRVLRGIDAALAAGIHPIKINTVVIRGENEGQLPNLVHFAADRGLEIRFIELMPMGPLQARWAERYVPEADMRASLESLDADWRPLIRHHDSARRFELTLPDGRKTVVGFITPMSCNFCSDCTRLRITSDGAVYPCLMDAPTANILPALRPAFAPELLHEILTSAMATKQPEHPHDGYGIMTHIGG